MGWAITLAQNVPRLPANSGAASLISCGPSCQNSPASSSACWPVMDEVEADVPACMTLPQHRTKLLSTNPITCLNGEIKCCTEVGILPNETAMTRLVGAHLLEQDDERSVQRVRYMTIERIGHTGDDEAVSLPNVTG